MRSVIHSLLHFTYLLNIPLELVTQKVVNASTTYESKSSRLMTPIKHNSGGVGKASVKMLFPERAFSRGLSSRLQKHALLLISLLSCIRMSVCHIYLIYAIFMHLFF